jgi:two-component system, OmpR family, alkaline phosphatase synthesis response regulator PhoP
MIKIILFSENKDNIKNISGILGLDEGFSVIVRGYDKSSDAETVPEDINMIILDFTRPDTGVKTEKLPEEFLKSKKLKIIIIDHGQDGLLLKNPAFADDFLYAGNIRSEILPRTHLLLKRSGTEVTGNNIVVGGLVLDLDKYELSVEGEVIVLTFKEFEMLKLLMKNKNKVFTRIKLLSLVWGYDYYGGSRTVDVHMRRLRSKIPLPYSDMLKTIRSVGYMFSSEK